MNSPGSRLYLVPGMTADFPVFSRIGPLLANSSIVDFDTPLPDESLRSYAMRISDHIGSDSVVIGVSFGGMLAQEIARVRGCKACVIISSIRNLSQLPPWLKLLRKMRTNHLLLALQTTGRLAERLPRRCSSHSTLRLRRLAGNNGDWYRWATTAVLKWEPLPADFDILQIHGTADDTFPFRYVEPDVTIRGGGHTLTNSHPIETAAAINDFVGAA